MDFKKLMSICLGMLGITAFTKNDAGAFAMSDDERSKISAAFGPEFTALFEKNLSTHVEEAAGASASEQEGADDLSTQMMEAVRNHNATQLAAGLKDLQNQLAAEKERNTTLQSTIAVLSASPEQLPAAEGAATTPRKEGKKSVMKINLNHKHYAGVPEFLNTGVQGAVTTKTIDAGELLTEFGTFLSQNQQNLALIRELVNGFTSSEHFTSVPAVTEYRAVRAFITSVVQQFTNKWSAAGKTKFTPIIVKNRRHKINFPIVPSEVLDSYMFHLYDEGLAPDQMPITKYIINVMLFPQILEDIELRMVFKGKFVEKDFDSDEAGIPEDSMDGLETILVEAKTTGDKGINFYEGKAGFAWETATAKEIIDHVNGFVDFLSPLYKTKAMNIGISHENLRRYERAYKEVWGQNSGQSGDFGTRKIDYSLNVLVAYDGMYSSPIMFSTPKQNMVKLRHKNEAPNVINDVQKHDYEVRLYGEFWLGVGFPIGEAVFAYVPEGYDPKAEISKNWGAATDYREGYKGNDAPAGEEEEDPDEGL